MLTASVRKSPKKNRLPASPITARASARIRKAARRTRKTANAPRASIVSARCVRWYPHPDLHNRCPWASTPQPESFALCSSLAVVNSQHSTVLRSTVLNGAARALTPPFQLVGRTRECTIKPLRWTKMLAKQSAARTATVLSAPLVLVYRRMKQSAAQLWHQRAMFAMRGTVRPALIWCRKPPPLAVGRPGEGMPGEVNT